LTTIVGHEISLSQVFKKSPAVAVVYRSDDHALRHFSARAEHRMEMAKHVPQRYPSNADSVGIEIVGAVVAAEARTRLRRYPEQ
jgi:hypothetical protein